MQAGLTGINPYRIYDPVKQSEKLDPKGDFIATWVPELARLSAPYRHRPWLAPGSVDYPTDLGAPDRHAQRARQRLKAYLERHRDERWWLTQKHIVSKHASRRRGHWRETPPDEDPNLTLF
jgi:deoxyribodipyrimidine photo-lyase